MQTAYPDASPQTDASAKKIPRAKLPSGQPNPVDVHIGNRLRQRRLLVGLSQEELAETIGVAFQQIQKYEHAINRISTGRLWDLAMALQCQVTYFFDEMDADTAAASTRHAHGDMPETVAPRSESLPGRDMAAKQETLKLVRSYYTIRNPEMRRQMLDLAAALAALKSAGEAAEALITD